MNDVKSKIFYLERLIFVVSMTAAAFEVTMTKFKTAKCF